MFEKILCPTDFSDSASKSIRYIKQLRGAGGQEVVILHVINQRTIDGLMRSAILEEEVKRWRQNVKATAQETLNEMAAELELLGFAVKTIVKTGYPSAVILDVEEQENPSMIVMGSHGRSNLGDMLLGSVSDRVTRRCRRPVLIVKRDAPD